MRNWSLVTNACRRWDIRLASPIPDALAPRRRLCQFRVAGATSVWSLGFHSRVKLETETPEL